EALMIVALGLLIVGLLVVQLGQLVIGARQVVVTVGVAGIRLDGLLEALLRALVISLLEHPHAVGVLTVRHDLAARASGQKHHGHADSAPAKRREPTALTVAKDKHGSKSTLVRKCSRPNGPATLRGPGAKDRLGADDTGPCPAGQGQFARKRSK